MDNENELDAQVDVVEQEEQTSVPAVEQEEESNLITIDKAKLKSLQRKAMAYEATKNKPLTTREPDEELVKSVKNLELIENKRQFGYEHGLSPEETDFIFKFAGGKPTKEVLENPFIKSGLEGFRASKRVEANTPSSTSRSPIFQGKDFKEMTEDERRKAFEEAASKRAFNK
jgi:hypothetical protein